MDSGAMKKSSQKAFSPHPQDQYPLGTVHLDSIFKTVFTDYQRQQFSFLMYTLEKSLQKVVKSYYEYTANSTNESNDVFINSLAFQRSSRQYLTGDMHCSKRSAKSRAGPSAELCSPWDVLCAKGWHHSHRATCHSWEAPVSSWRRKAFDKNLQESDVKILYMTL